MQRAGLMLIAICVFLSTAVTRGAEKPNIVFVMADDLGYGDVRCNHPQSKIATPAIDRLARQGLRFTDAHAPAAVCVPTRYGLMTGRYPFRMSRGGIKAEIKNGKKSWMQRGKIDIPRGRPQKLAEFLAKASGCLTKAEAIDLLGSQRSITPAMNKLRNAIRKAVSRICKMSVDSLGGERCLAMPRAVRLRRPG